MEHWSVYTAELMAIYYAISLVYQITRKKRSTLGMVERPATILSDSMSALQAIRNPSNKSGQRIIRATLQAASEMKARGIPIRLQWVPEHCDDPGNDEADRLAREAVGPRKMHPFQTFFRVKRVLTVKRSHCGANPPRWLPIGEEHDLIDEVDSGFRFRHSSLP
jgi:ribonuclease HI